jgi:Protein kinase domain
VPTRFGNYELLSRIGRGGMGETWKARRVGVAGAPVVVIKRILPEHAENAEFVESFVNEAHVTASLHHPAIAQVLDFGQVDGEYFFVIEFVHGRTVEDLLRRAAEKGLPTLPVPVACFIATQVLEGLEYAHSRVGANGVPLAIVHRDISPDNLLVGFDGTLKLVDFGVAKSKIKGRSQTQVGLVKGKWPFFSPEQAEGQALDGRSDLWAMGVVLYRMVCGRLPFEGEWFNAAARILRGEYPRPLSINPALPTPVVDAIDRALQVKREQRFQSAENMAVGLRSALEAAAPGFDRALFRGVVNWVFEDELAAERVRPAVPATARAAIARWVQEAEARPVSTGPGTPMGSTSAAHTALTMSAQLRERRPRSPWWWVAPLAVGAALLTVGAWWALRPGPPPPRPPVSLISPRAAAFDRVAAAYRALAAQWPDRAAPGRARFTELSQQAVLGCDAAADAEYVAACARFEGQLREALAAPGENAGAVDTPVFDAGLAAPATAIDEVAATIGKVQRVTLRSPGHNLMTLLQRSGEKHLVRIAPPEKVIVMNNGSTTFAVLTVVPGKRTDPREVGMGRHTTAVMPLTSVVRWFDFRPFAASTDQMGRIPGSAFSQAGKNQERKAEALPLSRQEGHFLLVTGLSAARSVKVRRVSPANNSVLTVGNCGSVTDFIDAEAITYTGVSACALALASSTPNASAVIEIDAR